MSSTKILQPSCSPEIADIAADHGAEIQEHRSSREVRVCRNL